MTAFGRKQFVQWILEANATALTVDFRHFQPFHGLGQCHLFCCSLRYCVRICVWIRNSANTLTLLGKFIESENMVHNRIIVHKHKLDPLHANLFTLHGEDWSSCGASESDDIDIRMILLRLSSHFSDRYIFTNFRNFSFSIWDTFASLLILSFNRWRDWPDFSIDASHMGHTSLTGGFRDFCSHIDSSRQVTQNKWPHFVATSVVSNVASHREHSLPLSSITFKLPKSRS